MTVIQPIWQTFGGQILHMAKRVKQCSMLYILQNC